MVGLTHEVKTGNIILYVTPKLDKYLKVLTNILKIKIFDKQDCYVDITVGTNFTTSQEAHADYVYNFFEVKYTATHVHS